MKAIFRRLRRIKARMAPNPAAQRGGRGAPGAPSAPRGGQRPPFQELLPLIVTAPGRRLSSGDAASSSPRDTRADGCGRTEIATNIKHTCHEISPRVIAKADRVGALRRFADSGFQNSQHGMSLTPVGIWRAQVSREVLYGWNKEE